MSVGFRTFVPKTCPTVFVVKNIAPEKKTIKIFNTPIVWNSEYDLMDVPQVSEADIRHSLLKGALNLKIKAKEVVVVDSNIDLLQFDECHKQFLEEAGITKGLEVEGTGGITELPFVFKQGVHLIGDKDNSNRTFTTPDKFINGTFGNNEFRILIKHNGRDLVEQIDYYVLESGGSGSGFDTIILTFSPKKRSTLVADYVVAV